MFLENKDSTIKTNLVITQLDFSLIKMNHLNGFSHRIFTDDVEEDSAELRVMYTAKQLELRRCEGELRICKDKLSETLERCKALEKSKNALMRELNKQNDEKLNDKKNIAIYTPYNGIGNMTKSCSCDCKCYSLSISNISHRNDIDLLKKQSF